MVGRKSLTSDKIEIIAENDWYRTRGTKSTEFYTLYERAADDITDDVRTYARDKDPVARNVRLECS